jgi:repressor LexA
MLRPILLETLVAMHKFEVQFGITPSYADLRKEMGLGHGTVKYRLNRLTADGYVVHQKGRNRSRKITSLGIAALKAAGQYQSNPDRNNLISCLGEIAAGYFTEPSCHQELIEMPNLDPEKHFALRVSGDSMTGVGIIDRMIVFFKRVPDGYEPKPGEIVAAYVEGLGTTLKRYDRQGKNVWLEAANPNYPPQIIDTEQTTIQIHGVWRGMLRVELS